MRSLASQNKNGWLAEGLWRTARLHERLKQNTEAAKFYERLLQEFPEFDRAPAVIASLAWMAAERGDNADGGKTLPGIGRKVPPEPPSRKGRLLAGASSSR